MKKIAGLVLLLASGIASGSNELRLNSTEDFVKFSSDVNSGTTFEGTTVLLEADVEFSSGALTSPIGDFEHYFLGTFDGQGSTIGGLALNLTSAKYAGLFGYTRGATIRNVVVDRSCATTSLFDAENDAYVGGIVGYCTAYYGRCTAENVVNMGSVAFAGSVYNYTLALGGIAGYVRSYSHAVSVVNCANYGAVTCTGDVGEAAFVGGVAGYFEGYSLSSSNAIANSANFGLVSYAAAAPAGGLFAGGFAGRAIYAAIENCVSAGRIDSAGSAGAVVGYGNFTAVKHSFWTADAGKEQAYGVEPAGASSLANSSLAAVDSALVRALNRHAHPRTEKWDRWILNARNAVFAARINSQRGVAVASSLVLLMEPRSSGAQKFGGWFADGILSRPFKATEIAADTTVYGAYGALVKVAFDAGKGSVSSASKVVAHGKPYGELPVPEVAGNEFIWWYAVAATDGANVPVTNATLVTAPEDHVLYAGWMLNTVTFVMGDGTARAVVVRYDERIVYPSPPRRKGFKFAGWDKDVNATMGVDVTITALWAKGSKMSSQMIAVCVVVPVVVIAIFVAVVVVVVIVVNRRKKKYKYVSINENMYKALAEASSRSYDQ